MAGSSDDHVHAAPAQEEQPETVEEERQALEETQPDIKELGTRKPIHVEWGFEGVPQIPLDESEPKDPSRQLAHLQ